MALFSVHNYSTGRGTARWLSWTIDYAEIFDGVPSQHDSKDAAVVAELAAQGSSWPWPLLVPSETEQESAYQVEWLEGQKRQTPLW